MQSSVQGGCGEKRLGNIRKRRKPQRRTMLTHGPFSFLDTTAGMAMSEGCAREASGQMFWGERGPPELRGVEEEEEEMESFDHSPASTSQKEAMSPSMWSTLPDHLLDSILARLPIQSFFRFRLVCKNWNTHMFSRSFLEAYADTPSQGPWFFFFTHDERNHVSTYDSSLNKWHRIPLSPPHSNTNSFSAADGGLVCYFSYENGSKSVVVCNPLTKSCRRLPPLLKVPSKVTMLAMVVDRVTKSYKVVVAGGSKYEHGVRMNNTAEVYDSQTQCWTTTGNIPATHTLKGKPVYSNGTLYARSHGQRNILLAYDMDQGMWSDLQVPLPSTVRHGELLEWQGRIMMVGELEEDHKIQSICIWELQNGSLKWKEVDRLPAKLFEGFFGDKDYFQCNERDDVILDWCQAGRFVLLFTYNLYDVRGRCKLLVYDLSKKSWQKLQSFSRTDVCGTGRIIRGIFHEPRLDATA
ncbi:hypothetical protein Mapa_004759 [Marchantia paleacea]|nr:hypothetical protein Mapa_004759 [Marchantia paleacea]